MHEPNPVARLHYELVHGLLETGASPANAELAERMNIDAADVESLLRELASIHGVVLHPHVCAPWILHPFSLTPTLNWVEAQHRGWWAPCIWCALGVATLAGGEVRIHSRFGAEGETLTIPVKDGEPHGFDSLVVHFAIPPARAWDNVHEHCAMVLPFRSADEIHAWSSRHRLPTGEPVPLHQVARLARLWYGSHARPDWHKWSVAEAQQIFHDAGLRSSFWDLGQKAGKF
ncbi:MAG: organomercurial lyase [Acidobacteriaceae bacterium]